MGSGASWHLLSAMPLCRRCDNFKLAARSPFLSRACVPGGGKKKNSSRELAQSYSGHCRLYRLCVHYCPFCPLGSFRSPFPAKEREAGEEYKMTKSDCDCSLLPTPHCPLPLGVGRSVGRSVTTASLTHSLTHHHGARSNHRGSGAGRDLPHSLTHVFTVFLRSRKHFPRPAPARERPEFLVEKLTSDPPSLPPSLSPRSLQIAYSFIPLLCKGLVLGPNVPIELCLLDIEPAKSALEGGYLRRPLPSRGLPPPSSVQKFRPLSSRCGDGIAGQRLFRASECDHHNGSGCGV
jgi:hypothetical protein